MKCNKLY